MCVCSAASEARGEGMENDCLLPVSPLIEAEMMRIDNVLSNFGDSSGEAPLLLPHQTPKRLKSCKKRKLLQDSIQNCMSSLHITVKMFLINNLLLPTSLSTRGWLNHLFVVLHWCMRVNSHNSCFLFLFLFLTVHVFLHIPAGGLGVRPAGRGLSLCDVTNLSPAAYRKFSCGGSSDSRCSTPVPIRKRRCTMAVNYKEPSLHA